MKTFLGNLVFACFAFLALSAEECGETHYISDSGFDIWCGSTLCGWDVLSGNVARAPSWHKSDYAVELLGEDVLITQLSTRASTSCLRFEVLADIDEDARVTLRIDYFDDGVVEYEQELGHVRWESLVHLVSTPTSWQGVRFSLHKEGPGRARLAQIEATADTACIDKPIELIDKPMGASCATGAECSSGYCAASPVANGWWNAVCSECVEDGDCDSGFVCGAGRSDRAFLLPPRSCVAEAAGDLGTQCLGAAECSTGVCCEGRCAECCSSSDCDGEVCDAASSDDSVVDQLTPNLCAGQIAEALCMSDADCESADCKGGTQISVCEADGRDCNANADCPGIANLRPPNCQAIGIAAGTCQ